MRIGVVGESYSHHNPDALGFLVVGERHGYCLDLLLPFLNEKHYGTAVRRDVYLET
jgi:hypothetical protein